VIRIPIIADDTRFAATLTAYEARVRALNAQLAALGATVGPGAVVMQPARRAAVAAVPRGSVQSPARAVGPETGAGGVALAAALGLGVAAAVKPPVSRVINPSLRAQLLNDPVTKMFHKSMTRAQRRHIKYSDLSLERAESLFSSFDSRNAGQLSPTTLGGRAAPTDERTRARLQSRILDRADKFHTSYQLNEDGSRTQLRSLQNTTMSRFNRRFSVAGRAKTLWRGRGNLEAVVGSMGIGAANTYRRINRGMRFMGGGMAALSVGSITAMSARSQEAREILLHEGKYTPGAAVQKSFKLTMPDVASFSISTAALAADVGSAFRNMIGLGENRTDFFTKTEFLKMRSEERAFYVSDQLRLLRGELSYNRLRENLHVQAEGKAETESIIMALRALEVGFSSGTGTKLRSAYFAEIKPFYAKEAEQELTDKIVGRKD
jgi:hypothetical protein